MLPTQVQTDHQLYQVARELQWLFEWLDAENGYKERLQDLVYDVLLHASKHLEPEWPQLTDLKRLRRYLGLQLQIADILYETHLIVALLGHMPGMRDE